MVKLKTIEKTMSRPEALSSLAGSLGPVAQPPHAQFHGTTSYASPRKPSGNVRSCASAALTDPGPIRGNPSLRAENPNRDTALNGHCNTHAPPPNRCTVLQCVAVCCTVFGPEIFSRSTATPHQFAVGRLPSHGVPWRAGGLWRLELGTFLPAVRTNPDKTLPPLSLCP